MPEAELMWPVRNVRIADEAAFAELNHRVANNLQILGALLVRAERAGPPVETSDVAEVAKRLAIMSALHRRLCSPLSSVVTVEAHLSALCEDVRALHGRADVALLVQADELSLSPAQENAVCLITAELVANALRHAFPAGSGRITVCLASDAGEVTLSVSDDGCGLADIGLLSEGDRNGLRIVRGLAGGIGGVVSAASEPGRGLRVAVDFLTRGDAHLDAGVDGARFPATRAIRGRDRRRNEAGR